MKAKAIVFLDYNETIEDLSYSKGKVFCVALRRLIKLYDGNLDIVVITKADPEKSSIKSEVALSLTYIQKDVRKYFGYLVEGSCKYICQIDHSSDYPVFKNRDVLSLESGTKKDGVERTLKYLDAQNEIKTCIFAGDHEEIDLVMMDADVGLRDKYFVLANRRVLKAAKHPVYKLNMEFARHNKNVSSDIEKTLGQTKNLIIKSKCQSYGVGKGLEAVTNLLEYEKTGLDIKLNL